MTSKLFVEILILKAKNFNNLYSVNICESRNNKIINFASLIKLLIVGNFGSEVYFYPELHLESHTFA